MTAITPRPAVPAPLGRPAGRLPAGRLLAIASGKGGVGKTWFAITLAHALSRRGERVLLFDGDLGLANVDIQLGLTPAHDLGSVIEGQITLQQASTRHEGGFDILAGQSGSGTLSQLALPVLDGLLEELRSQSRLRDRVVLDLGAGLDRSVRHMSAFVDTLLVLVTEEPTSLTDAYAAIKLHAADAPDRQAMVVVNQATTRSSGERTYATLARACQAFLGRTPPLLGVVRRDDRVRDAIRRQSLFLTRHPTAPAASDIEAIAAGLQGD